MRNVFKKNYFCPFYFHARWHNNEKNEREKILFRAEILLGDSCIYAGSQQAARISKSSENSLLLEGNWCREICLRLSSLNISESSQKMCLCSCFPPRQTILLGWQGESAVDWLGQGLSFSQDRSQYQSRTERGSLKNQHTGLEPGLFYALCCWGKMLSRKKETLSRSTGKQNYPTTCKEPSQPWLCQCSKVVGCSCP